VSLSLVVGCGVFTGLLIGSGMVAKARWDNGVVHGPLVPGTAKVLAARKRWLVTALYPTEETFEEPFLSEIELRIDVRGRESYTVTRSFWITPRKGEPIVGERYLVRVSATDPSRFRVEWNKPYYPTIPTSR